ncbi:MAG: hypothetical protein U0V74_17210 [Chitinophagales bacterium]
MKPKAFLMTVLFSNFALLTILGAYFKVSGNPIPYLFVGALVNLVLALVLMLYSAKQKARQH